MMKVIVGLSGGVDSAVVCSILKDKGYEVVGVQLCLYSPGNSGDRSEFIAKKLGIQFLSVSLEETFRRKVISPFVESWRGGLTPNPCIICNEKVKFSTLLSIAKNSGDGVIATGHYARIAPGPDGMPSLFRGADPLKDQSYMLYRIPREMLASLILPLGGLKKSRVLDMGFSLFPGLFEGVTESEDICFVSRGQLPEFLENRAGPFAPGRIINESGETLGWHSGLHRFTIGQRKGLGLSGGPWYVTGLNPATNELVVGKVEMLRVRKVHCNQAVWHQNPVKDTRLQACHRYRSKPVNCILEKIDDHAFSCFSPEGIQGVAPGQSLVLYSADRVYGGGIIEKTERGGPN